MERAVITKYWKVAGRHLARALFTLIALVAVLFLVLTLLDVVAGQAPSTNPFITWGRVGLLGADAIGCLSVVVLDFTLATQGARRVARATLAIAVTSLVADIAYSGIGVSQLFYVAQFLLIISFQSATDEELRRGHSLPRPWDKPDDEARRVYIPLNFFNIFWVFAVASVVGLVIEVFWHLLTTGEYQDRAGVLWGPFSPIYGIGAVLMTIVLNRWWNRSKIVIFIVSAFIGAVFEYAVSWWMEDAFGIVAWDYSDTFLNIGGRTSVIYACAWGFLGLVWIRLLLPDILALVERIPLRWRVAVTVLAALVLVVDGAMTLIVLDRWYARSAGHEPEGAVASFIDANYGDEFMEKRFQTMQIDDTRAGR